MAVLRQGARVVTLGEAFALIVADQAVVVVTRGRQAEKVLEDHLHRREIEQILAPYHMGDAMIGVIKGCGEEIGHDILALARQDHIADPRDRLGSVDPVVPRMGGAGFSKADVCGRTGIECGGQMKAQVMSAIRGMTEPTGWHYHKCEAQFIYLMKGWVDLEFEDGRKLRIKAGESLYIPGGLRHNETATSDDLEILEVAVPADMGTQACDPPPGMKA